MKNVTDLNIFPKPNQRTRKANTKTEDTIV